MSIEAQAEFDENNLYIKDWTIEIHFWDKCFRCSKSYGETRWFGTLEEAIIHCSEY